ncbi:MAG: hypothetical protein LBR10_07205 [Prevotellaceae bacterium]|jgi:hypothetical protein|nr:hypothetical protein [Prevotellaceae bacterium]
MKKKIFITFLSVLALAGCREDEAASPQIAGKLVGCWVLPQYEDGTNGNTVISYQRADALNGNAEGIRFLNSSTLIERKNAGSCGTPPIFYDDFEGSYRWINERTVSIDVAFWGGMDKQTWNIISLTDTTLKIEILARDISYNEQAQTFNTAGIY